VQGIGWWLEEASVAQVSMNLTDHEVTPIHSAYEEVCKDAAALGLPVVGSEIVGLVPLKALLQVCVWSIESATDPESDGSSGQQKSDLEWHVSTNQLLDYLAHSHTCVCVCPHRQILMTFLGYSVSIIRQIQMTFQGRSAIISILLPEARSSSRSTSAQFLQVFLSSINAAI
jgi:hypothetical protein